MPEKPESSRAAASCTSIRADVANEKHAWHGWRHPRCAPEHACAPPQAAPAKRRARGARAAGAEAGCPRFLRGGAWRHGLWNLVLARPAGLVPGVIFVVALGSLVVS